MRAMDLVTQLQPNSDKRLVLECAGRRIRPGYHVTEIKTASFRSLDCGARLRQWEEVIVQLWDVADEREREYMPVRKFLGIWRKVESDVGLNGHAEVKFEWGDATNPAVHYTFASLRVEGDALIVSVEPVRATCKLRDDWWLAQGSGAVCCAPADGAMIGLDAIRSDPPDSAGVCCR
ncbi:MAG: hypothetical protein KatS3mg053_1728 [Candidatus Roseilinea sp.]|nr:MAG: hypothetical protein KatS3mg053_1728 [Candidatus Roseilinea sp.]